MDDKFQSYKNRDFLKINEYKSQKDNEIKLMYGKQLNDREVSVAIPTYNRTNDLIRLVKTILAQDTKVKFDIIITENGQDNELREKTINALKELNDNRILYYCNSRNVGGYANWDCAIEKSNAKYVVFTNDDDIVHPKWIEYQYNEIIKTDADIVSCKYKSIKTKEDEKKYFLSEINPINSEQTNVINMIKEFKYPVHGSIMKKEVFNKIGGFVRDASNCEDYFFMVKACYYFKVRFMPLELYGYQINDNAGSNQKGVWEDCFIAQHFMRINLMNKLGYNKKASKRRSDFLTIRDIEIKNKVKSSYSFSHVDEDIIVSVCEIPNIRREVYKIIWAPKMLLKNIKKMISR